MLQAFLEAGRLEAGCDEAGRGCIAGPVCAAAVILPEQFDLPLLNDSKKLTQAAREHLRPEIERQALAYAVAFVSPKRIDTINILQASFEAMHKALKGLAIKPDFLLIDGNRFRPFDGIPHECIIKGDGRMASIAAASILAKTYRDDYMLNLHSRYPHYQWHKNKGYPTTAHREAVRLHGLCPHHRRSFACLPTQLTFGL